MENRPHIVIVGRIVPPDVELKYHKWYDEVYAPTYVKNLGTLGIDRYKILKKTLEYPGSVLIYHRPNRKSYEETTKNPIRADLERDRQTTFYRVEWVWHDVYTLTGSFKNDSSSRDTTIVENAPVIHIEGYRVPPAEQERYDLWFMKWASRIYIPVQMKSPGLKAYNCFKLSDLSLRWPNRKYLETEVPPYVSILHFENLESLENYQGSPEYAWLKRNIELEFPGGLSTKWNVDYQLVKSWRK